MGSCSNAVPWSTAGGQRTFAGEVNECWRPSLDPGFGMVDSASTCPADFTPGFIPAGQGSARRQRRPDEVFHSGGPVSLIAALSLESLDASAGSTFAALTELHCARRRPAGGTPQQPVRPERDQVSTGGAPAHVPATVIADWSATRRDDPALERTGPTAPAASPNRTGHL